KPLISLGRGFSAPAIFRTALEPGDRAVLMGKDSDAFNRWEAGQVLATGIMLELASGSGTDSDYLAAIGDVLKDAESDPAFAAQMLMPPTESELAGDSSLGQRIPVDPEGLHAARLALIRAIATTHRPRLLALYEAMRDQGDFRPDARSAGRRA